MRAVLTEVALQEFNDATQFYEMEFPGLGSRFRNEVRRASKRMERYPLAFPIERGDIRRCLLNRFPYKLLYAVEGDVLVILAVAHQHRRPDYWVDKIET